MSLHQLQPQANVPLVITSPPKTKRSFVVIAVDVHEPVTVTGPLKVFVPVSLLRTKVPATVVAPVTVSLIPDILAFVAERGTLKVPKTFRIRLLLDPVIWPVPSNIKLPFAVSVKLPGKFNIPLPSIVRFKQADERLTFTGVPVAIITLSSASGKPLPSPSIPEVSVQVVVAFQLSAPAPVEV